MKNKLEDTIMSLYLFLADRFHFAKNFFDEQSLNRRSTLITSLPVAVSFREY